MAHRLAMAGNLILVRWVPPISAEDIEAVMAHGNRVLTDGFKPHYVAFIPKVSSMSTDLRARYVEATRFASTRCQQPLRMVITEKESMLVSAMLRALVVGFSIKTGVQFQLHKSADEFLEGLNPPLSEPLTKVRAAVEKILKD